MACSECGEYRFSSAAQAGCHSTMNHATFRCGCGHKFLTEKSLSEHKDTMKKNLKANPCSDCCRSFDTSNALSDHKRDKGHSPPVEKNRCECGRLCKSPDGLAQHVRAKQAKLGIKDSTCKSKGEFYDKYYKDKVMVSSDDRKYSVKRCNDVVQSIMAHVRKQDGGNIYSSEIRKAGSHATSTKVGKADEFDTNIPLRIPIEDVKTMGTVPYKLEPRDPKKASGQNLNVPRNLIDTPRGRQQHIPLGYATAKTSDNIPGTLTRNGDVIPRKIQEDLYQRIQIAQKDLGMKNVHLSRNAHGPAITLTITDKRGKHDINVDITPTIDDSRVPVGIYGWPRPDTRKALSKDTIERVNDKGTHLVPKGGEFWNVSHSNAEKELMKGLDKGNDCRRHCYKMLKADFQTWKSQSKDGFPGISSHLLKHAMFWRNERQERPDPDYWKQGNVSQCYTDYLKSFKNHLDRSKLPNYFNPMENMLAKKDKEVLHRLASCVDRRRDELLHMKLSK